MSADLSSHEAAAVERAERIRSHAEEAWRLLAEAWSAEDWRTLGYSSFVAYGQAEFGMSARSIGRTLAWANVQAALEAAAGEALPALSQREAVALEPVLPAATGAVRKAKTRGADPATAVRKAVERAGQPPPKTAGQRGRRARRNEVIPVDSTEVTAETPERAGVDNEPAPSGPPAAAPPPRNSTERVPTLRQEANTYFEAVHEAAEGVGAKWTPDQATYLDNRHQREMAAWRAANGQPEPTPARRQGTVSRPAPSANGTLHRPQVTPRFKAK